MEFARLNPLTRVTDIFRKIGRVTLSREVQSSGQNRLTEILAWLRGKACCVVLDGGFKGKRDFVVASLLLPYFGMRPVFFALFVCAGTREAYAKLGADIIGSLSAKGIRVVSFCTDGLKHQVMCFFCFFHCLFWSVFLRGIVPLLRWRTL
jgi:hypothetical protein